MTDSANTNPVGISAPCGNGPNPSPLPSEGRVASQREAVERVAAYVSHAAEIGQGAILVAASDLRAILALASPTEQASDVSGLVEARERIADPRNVHFAGDAQVVAREALSQAQQVKP